MDKKRLPKAALFWRLRGQRRTWRSKTTLKTPLQPANINILKEAEQLRANWKRWRLSLLCVPCLTLEANDDEDDFCRPSGRVERKLVTHTFDVLLGRSQIWKVPLKLSPLTLLHQNGCSVNKQLCVLHTQRYISGPWWWIPGRRLLLLLGVRSLHDQGRSGDEWRCLLQLLLAAVECGRQGSADRPHVFSCGFVNGASL